MERKPNVVHIDALDAQQSLHTGFSVGNDIIDYIEPARTFGRDDLIAPDAKGRYQQRMIALPDRSGPAVQPMVLTLGKQNMLSLVRRDDTCSAGWQSIPVHNQVVAFGAAWGTIDGKELTTLAVALDEGKGASRLLVAYSIDAQTADFSRLEWLDYGTREGLVIDAIRVLRGDDGVWTTLLSASGKGGQDAYLVRSDLPASLANDALRYSVPRDMKEIFDISVGLLGRHPVVHVLGTGTFDDEPSLNARVLPTYKGGLTPTETYPFECPAGARVLAMGQTRKAGTDVYLAGEGVLRLPAEQLRAQDDAVFEQVIPSSLASNVRQLSVCESAQGATSVWALQGDGSVLMVHRSGKTPWSEPLVIRRNVVDLAPVAGDDKLTSGVLVVYETGEAGHLWRDVDGLWQETPIRVSEPEDSASITCFSTNVHILDANGLPRADVAVQLRASVLSTLVVNGRSVTVGPHNPVQVKTDWSGNLRIFNRALSFTPASYALKLDGLEQVLEINPAVSLYQRFTHMTAKDLQAAQLGEGKGSLLPEQYRGKEGSQSVDTLLTALQQAASLVSGSQSGGVQLRNSIEDFSSALDIRHVPNDFCLSVAGDGKGKLYTLQPNALASATANAILPGLGQSLSDLLEGLWYHAQSAASFVIRKVQGAVEFVCEVAGKVKRFVLDTLEKIGGFFGWLWQQVRTGAEKVWSYAKFLFDWGDITAVRNAMADSFDEGLTEVVNRISGLKNVVGSAFDKAIGAIRQQCIDLDIRADDPALRAQGSGSILKDQRKSESTRTDVSNSGPGGGTQDLLSSILELMVKVDMPPPIREYESLFSLFGKKVEVFSNLGKQINQDFAHIFGSTSFSLVDLDFDKIKRIVYSVVLNIAEAATTFTRNLVLQLMESIAQLVDVLRRIMFATIRFPFIEKTLKLLTGADLDTGVRLVDIVLFLPSILGTVTYKLFKGETPLQAMLKNRAADKGTQNANDRAFKYLQGVVSTYKGLMMTAYSIPSAAAGVTAQVATKPLDWLKLVASTGMLVMTLPRETGKTPLTIAQSCQHTTFWVGLTAIGFKAWHLNSGRAGKLPIGDAAIVGTLAVAAVDIALKTVQSTMKITTLAYDESGNILETLQYVASNSVETLFKACLFNPDPLSRNTMVLVGAAGSLNFDYMVGMIRHGLDAQG